METVSPDGCPPLRAAEFAKIRQLAYDTFGLDLRAGKETLVATRLRRQILQSGCRSFEEYYQRVVGDSTGESLIRLIDALATNHTAFFREPAHFQFLRHKILPQRKGRGLAIWSAACSTGEEPYSIAMCAVEELGLEAAGQVRILATDISTQALAKAQRGIYPAERFGGVSEAQLRKHWLRGSGEWQGSYRTGKAIRAMVEFRRLNLLQPGGAIGRFPLIFCRNVMIYFDKATQSRVAERLADCLEPGGHLFTGHAESLTGIEHGLRYVQPAVYAKADGGERGKW